MAEKEEKVKVLKVLHLKGKKIPENKELVVGKDIPKESIAPLIKKGAIVEVKNG